MAFLSNPELLILDEPFEFIDETTREQIVELLKQTSINVAISSPNGRDIEEIL